MIILGLGTNLGDKLENMRKALRAIKAIPGVSVLQVSPIYLSDAMLPENAPADWDQPYLNAALRCETSLAPFDLLAALKKIEASMGRKAEIRHWGPRVMDIDILAWDDRVITSEALSVPRPNLFERPFQLWPMADIAPFWQSPIPGKYQSKTAEQIVEMWGSRFSGEAPFRTKQIYHRIDTPVLVGVLNVTPDSFSDGNHFLAVDKACAQAVKLLNTGAEIIDIGAESTRPNKATPLTPAAEWARLEPVLQAIQAAKSDFLFTPKISIDTRHAETARKALAFGVDWINDVTGCDEEEMIRVLAQSTADCLFMHHLRIPEDRVHVLSRDQDPVKLVYAWGEQRLEELIRRGIARERLIFDPGIGFGKMAEQSLALLKQVDVFAQLGVRILVGHSRKSFMNILTPCTYAERDLETAVVSLHLAKQPIDYIRVHSPEFSARAWRVALVL